MLIQAGESECTMPLLHEDRFFPGDRSARDIAKRIHESVRGLPIVSPHGHPQAAWFARNRPFPNPAKLFVQPDHYIYRMLYSQGISLEDLEIGAPEIKNPRQVWRIFAQHYYLFRGTPTRMWLDFVFQELFGLKERLSAHTADITFDTISEKLRTPEFLPRALYERFNIEVLATTDSPLDSLNDHRLIRDSGWKMRIVPTFRPDSLIDADFAGFRENIEKLGSQTAKTQARGKGMCGLLRRRGRDSRSSGAPRPTTDASAHALPISPPKMPRISLAECLAGVPMPNSRNFSARRCSQRWHA
jgi:glucuronate isomerase